MNFSQKRGISGNNGKPQNRIYTLKRLWDYLMYYKWIIIIVIILTIVSNLLALVGPLLSGYCIDAIISENNVDFKNVYLFGTLMIVFYLISSGLSYLISVLMVNVSKKIVLKMRRDCFESLLKLPVSYFDSNQIGDIISKISYDIDTVNVSLSTDLVNICTSVVTVITSLVMMIIISPILVLVFVITIPIALLFTRFMVRRTRPMFRNRSKKLGELNGNVEEAFSSLPTIQAYSRKEDIIARFDEVNNQATTASFKAEVHGGITGPGVNFVNNLSFSLICLFGALLNYYYGLTLGNIQSFILYSKKFSGPINETANIFIELQSSMAAAERVFNLIDAEKEPVDTIDAINIQEKFKDVGDVKLKNVEFSYNKERKIIKGISFDAKKGEVIALVGPTGCGKTTIVNLLMRFYDINKGVISLNDTNILDITRKSLRHSYSMVLQDTWLFEDTIYNNIAYGATNVTIEDVKRVCKLARVDGFINRLPQGYDTILSEGGVNISKGQKQLLTIARAMLLDCDMLILDEATSNVDTRSELLIQEAMKELARNKTCFIIAHRLSTIKNADKILVMKEGQILEVGTHQELLDKEGFYYSLYQSQFE